MMAFTHDPEQFTDAVLVDQITWERSQYQGKKRRAKELAHEAEKHALRFADLEAERDRRIASRLTYPREQRGFEVEEGNCEGLNPCV
jgi:hypothetical protein